MEASRCESGAAPVWFQDPIVLSVRPRIAELVFQLYGRSLHPELFDILAFRRIERDDCSVTIRITRSGHVITWEKDTQCLTEVTASHDEPLPERRRLLSYKLRGERSKGMDETAFFKLVRALARTGVGRVRAAAAPVDGVLCRQGD